MLSLIQAEDYIICADGGTLHALKLGLKPDLIIGDLDSLPQGDWKRLQRADIPIELFPQDKNETDLELALRSAQERLWQPVYRGLEAGATTATPRRAPLQNRSAPQFRERR